MFTIGDLLLICLIDFATKNSKLAQKTATAFAMRLHSKAVENSKIVLL
jgi:hypothetical protein